MPPPCSLSSRARTVAGTPNSRDLTGARAPLLSHTTARSRQASTSFESQATRAGRRLESQPAGTPQRYESGSLPSRQGPATPTYNWADIARSPKAGGDAPSHRPWFSRAPTSSCAVEGFSLIWPYGQVVTSYLRNGHL